MLFDLKGRRKRFIQVVYVALAFLFAVGLVGFGIGGGVSGGFFDALSGGGGGSSSSSELLKRYEQRVRLHPKSEKARLNLVRGRYSAIAGGNDYDRNTGQFSSGAADDLQLVARDWERYLALKPKKPDPGVATIMVQTYAVLLQYNPTSVLETLRKAARAQEIVNKARPSPNGQYILARIYYFLGETAKGDRAARRALAGTPKDQRNTIRADLRQTKNQGVKAQRAARKQKQLAEQNARKAIKKGQDPFGAQPGSSPLGGAGGGAGGL
jgi:hypothetical protein